MQQVEETEQTRIKRKQSVKEGSDKALAQSESTQRMQEHFAQKCQIITETESKVIQLMKIGTYTNLIKKKNM